ncbi:hypothetical protein PI125_g23630 [Phytophthora idaei]|nr:hypothetical protein PI125_g23630 [Phytophthora idaei]
MTGTGVGKKVKKANTVKVKKALVVTKKRNPSPTTAPTVLEKSIASGEIDEVDDVADLIYPTDVPMSETSSPPKDEDGGMKDFDDEVSQEYTWYLGIEVLCTPS